MNIIEGISQGNEDWHGLRAKHFCASEAAAAMGLSKYMMRNDLLRIKATGIQPEVDAGTQRRFDQGHAAEAAARGHVEATLGESLFPCVGTLEVDGLPLLCSFDGLTMAGDVSWETKLFNQSLLDYMTTKADVPDTHWPQLEHNLMVSGAERLYFTVSDGTADGTVGIWYESRPERRAQLIAGWKQFKDDLAAYVPPEVITAAVAAPQTQLPALSIEVSGSIALHDNLKVFGRALSTYVERINKTPETDQDFADLEATVKNLKKAEDALDAAENSALAQTVSIDEMRRTVGEYRELAKSNRLLVEKLVKSEKENRRNAIVAAGRQAFQQHVAGLNTRIGKPYMPAIADGFATVIKGLKTIASIQNAVDTEVSRLKIESSAIADKIDANLKTLREKAEGFQTLFPDTASLVLKMPDDLEATIDARIAHHKAAEEVRRIAEEQRKANEAVQAAPSTAPPSSPALTPLETTKTMAVAVPIKDDGRKVKLGDICARVGMTFTADFLARLGFVAEQEKNARLYKECEFIPICEAIAAHVLKVAEGIKAAA